MNKLSHIEDMNLAYLAGFFDGEGFISIERVGKLSQNLSIGRGPKAEKALSRLLPYLRVKRERAEIAITFEKLRQYHFSLYGTQRHPDEAWQARESLRDRILQLNYRVVGHTRQPRAQPQGNVDRSLKAKRLAGVVPLFERKEA